MPIVRTLLGLVLTLAASSPGAAQDVLRNGDFEAGGKYDVVDWAPIWPRSIQDPAPEFEHPKGDSRGGKRFGRITTYKPGGYTSFTQSIENPPEEARHARLSGWIRVDQLGEESSASLLLVFSGSGGSETLGMHWSTRLSEVADWTRVEVEAAVPEGAERWMVRCGVLGEGRVCFDEIELTASNEVVELTRGAMAVHHGDYVVRAERKLRAPTIALSIPFPFERQTPLAVRVISDPPDSVARLEVLVERENRPLEVTLEPMEAGTQVKLRVETLVLVADRPAPDGRGVELASPKRVPREVKPHLKGAPGIDLDDEDVRAAAAGLSRDDLQSLMRDLAATLEERLEYDAGATQGASECLERGKAVCTGFANVAASLLIAAEVPTRILACTQRAGRLQEHYIVEAWTPMLGWSRVESTMARFPWRDSYNLVLRVVYPDSKRSAGDVPLYVVTGGGAGGGFDLDPQDSCWQGAHDVGELQLGAGLVGLEEHARAAFEALERKSVKASFVRFAPETSAAGELELGERQQDVLRRVDAWTKL